jgi:tetratricopeptide (TPR) repeat protein
MIRVIFCLSLFLSIFSCGDKVKPVAPAETTDNPPVIPPIDTLLASINKKIAADPGNFQNYLDRARYYGGRTMFENALEDLSRALAADSTKGSVYLYRGEVYFQQERVKEAYEEYKTCLRFDEGNTDCMLKKAGIDIQLGNNEIAIKLINDALRINETLPYAYYLKGRMYKKNGDTTLAVSSYQSAIEVDPNYYDAYIECGLLFAQRKSKLATEYYNSAITLKPRSIEAWYNKAMFFQENGKQEPAYYPQAFTCYDSILSIDPTFAAAAFNKGYINLVFLADCNKGAQDFTEALQKFPNYFQAYHNRGLCYEKLGKLKEAEADYRAALAIQPDYTEAAKSLEKILR